MQTNNCVDDGVTQDTVCDAGCDEPLCPDSPDGNHHAAPIGSDEDLSSACTQCWYCGEKETRFTCDEL